MRDAVIVSAVRTPTGKFLGALKELTAPQLGALVVADVHAAGALGLDLLVVPVEQDVAAEPASHQQEQHKAEPERRH